MNKIEKENSQLTYKLEIVQLIKDLNPKAIIKGVHLVFNTSFKVDSSNDYLIHSSIPGEELKLPEGFSYNKKNKTITNDENHYSIKVEYVKTKKIESINNPTEEEKKSIKSIIVTAIKNLKRKRKKEDVNGETRSNSHSR